MKHGKVILLFFFFQIFCCIMFSCRTTPEGHFFIRIMNNSSSIFYQVIHVRHITDADTLIKCNKQTVYIPSDSFFLVSGLQFPYRSLEDEFKTTQFVQFIIMDGEQFKYYCSYPCDTIRKYVPVLQRYRLNLEDLQKLDWSVPYPPTEAMKDMDIYPPYQGTSDN